MNWLRNDLLVLILIVLVAIALGFSPMLIPVQAAEPTNIVTACVKIATTGEIDYWYCQGDEGPAFVANSMGFLAIEQ